VGGSFLAGGWEALGSRKPDGRGREEARVGDPGVASSSPLTEHQPPLLGRTGCRRVVGSPVDDGGGVAVGCLGCDAGRSKPRDGEGGYGLTGLTVMGRQEKPRTASAY
jgi:hypothetical protein